MIQAKASLHLHIDQDPLENIAYSGFQAIDEAHSLGFNVIAFTCHDKVVDINPFVKYAQNKKILLIQGIEKTIQKKHVLILNATKDCEQINNFEQLEHYKENNPNCFIIAPHPYFIFGNCLKKDLVKHIHIFDAIEYNFFYHKYFNPNKKAEEIANKYQKPLIGTSDVHLLEYFNPTYTIISTETLTNKDIFNAIKKNQLEIITKSFSILELIKILYKMLSIGSK